jgi:hypothetical protein
MKSSVDTGLRLFTVHRFLLWFVVVGTLGFSQISAHAATWLAGPLLGTARGQFAGGVIDGKIFVFGGNRNPDGRNLNSTEMLDPVLGSWVYKADNNDC